MPPLSILPLDPARWLIEGPLRENECRTDEPSEYLLALQSDFNAPVAGPSRLRGQTTEEELGSREEDQTSIEEADEPYEGKGKGKA